MNVSDAELVARAQGGDLEAYAALVERHRAGLERYAYHLLGNRQDAEEALQDALLRAFRAIRQCRQPERFRAWLARILVNRCRTRLTRWNPFVSDEPRNGAGGAAVAHPEDQRAWLEEIHRALGTLPADHREAFLLKHVEAFSYEEMAELTGASVPALKMRVNRACDRLRTLLEDVYRDG
jgi:RNA polymerase sigma-70 factor, ECF subfamily